MINHTVKNADIDGVLSDYFKAEMPALWPAWRAPAARSGAPRRSGWAVFRRFAVAASIVGLLAAYLALAGFFPREIVGKLHNDPSRHIGLKPGPGK